LTLLPRRVTICRQVFKTCWQTSFGEKHTPHQQHPLLRSGRRTCSDPPTIPPLHRHIVCRPPSYYSSSSAVIFVYSRHRMSFPLIRPPLQTRRNNAPHPSAGGRGTGYDQTMRELVLAIHNSGNSNDLFVQNLKQQRLIPSLRSEYRYLTLNATRGHVRACRRTGNNRATVLRGHDIFLLALYRIVFPKATAAEVNAFLYRANYGNLHFRFYSSAQITEAEKRIHLTRKKGSTTAYQALLPINIQKHWEFWNLPYPYGIADIRRQDIIDLDECGVEVMSGDRSWGKAYVGKRVGQPGAWERYKNQSNTCNLW
jgi:hypothetical protein